MVTVLLLFFLAAVAPYFSGEVSQCIVGHSCRSTALDCKDTVHSFNCSCVCSCGPGLQFDGKACVDINECASPLSPRGPGIVCLNTVGSNICTLPPGSVCPTGFVFLNGACMDINESTIVTKSVGGACPNDFVPLAFETLGVNEKRFLLPQLPSTILCVLPVQRGTINMASTNLQLALWKMTNTNAPELYLEDISLFLAKWDSGNRINCVKNACHSADPRLEAQLTLYRSDELARWTAKKWTSGA